jgi:hypothetical protein
MTSQAKIAANQANGRKSRGPVTPLGQAISSLNGLKHGRRSKRLALMADISYSVEERRIKWMAAHDASNDMEEYIIARNAVIASKLDRIERADVEGFRSCVENFDEKEREEALALVGRLFHNRWGSAASYGISLHAPNGPTTSFSAQSVEVEEPAAIVEKLESSECGARLLLDSWDRLREQLGPEKFWQSPDRFRAIRLLKHQPADAREDRDVAAVFYASARLEPWRRKPFRELRSDYSPRELTELRDEVADRFPELEKLKEPDECRAVLFEISDRNIERLEEILAAHEENADAQAKRVVAREGFDTSPRAKQLNDFEIRYTNVLYRGMKVYKEIKGRTEDGGRRAEGGGRRTEGGRCLVLTMLGVTAIRRRRLSRRTAHGVCLLPWAGRREGGIRSWLRLRTFSRVRGFCRKGTRA